LPIVCQHAPREEARNTKLNFRNTTISGLKSQRDFRFLKGDAWQQQQQQPWQTLRTCSLGGTLMLRVLTTGNLVKCPVSMPSSWRGTTPMRAACPGVDLGSVPTPPGCRKSCVSRPEWTQWCLTSTSGWPSSPLLLPLLRCVWRCTRARKQTLGPDSFVLLQWPLPLGVPLLSAWVVCVGAWAGVGGCVSG
jgi:hypothetical protein